MCKCQRTAVRRLAVTAALVAIVGLCFGRPAAAQSDDEIALGAAAGMLLTGGGLPLGMPPAEPDPLMTRVLPDDCLLYIAWQGTAEPDADSPNHTEALLAEPEMQHLFAEVERAVLGSMKGMAARSRPGDPKPEDIFALAKTLTTRPVVIYVAEFFPSRQGMDIDAGIVVNVGDQAEAFRRLLPIIGGKSKPKPGHESEEEPTTTPEGPWQTIDLGPGSPPVQWAIQGEHLIVGIGEGAADRIVARAETPPPAWVGKLHEEIAIERLGNVVHVNQVAELIRTFAIGEPEVYRALRAIGLSDVESITSATGLDESGCVSKLLLKLDGAPRGALSVFDVEPLAKEDLAVIPADATLAAAVRFDLAEAMDTLLDVVGRIEPREEEMMLRDMARAESELGIRFRRDLFAAVGDIWRIYNSPREGGLVFTGATAVVDVRDHERLVETNKRLVELMRRELGPRDRDPENRSPYDSRRRGATIEEFTHRGQTVFFLNIIGDEMPFAPAWCITGDELIGGLFPQSIRAYLDRKAGNGAGGSLADVPEVAALFDGGRAPLGLIYTDTPELFRMAYPVLLIFAQMGCSELQSQGIDITVGALPSAPVIARHLRPGVLAIRRTDAGIVVETRRTLATGGLATAALVLPMLAHGGPEGFRTPGDVQSMNNLKQIGTAMHNHRSAMRRFPADITDEDGKPLLSWRVKILPYLEQQALYEEFHLDEPWNSPHNMQLLGSTPQIYRAPRADLPKGGTTYLGMAGKDAVFSDPQGTRMEDIHDGTSMTIAVVQAADSKAVPWTKPADFEYDEDNPIAGLVNSWDIQFNALMCDASVHAIREAIHPRVLKALFTRGGGEPVDWEEIRDPQRYPRRGYDEKPAKRPDSRPDTKIEARDEPRAYRE
ncbi:MAG: DUF1559 domain-containing protein [Planctomycetes bacterium]|nr:DUF1559 domain-containing protein [Planctomycetota bacterium]